MPGQAGNADLGQLYARVSERVENQGREIHEIRSNMNTGFMNIQASVASLANDTRQQISSLTNTMSERNKTPWGVLISAGLFILAVVGGLGTMAIKPIMDNQVDTALDIRDIKSSTMTRAEIEWRGLRSQEDRARVEKNMDQMNDKMLPRIVWEERNHARDVEIADIKRRMDEFAVNQGSVYGQRDVILDLKRQVESLEMRLIQQQPAARSRM